MRGTWPLSLETPFIKRVTDIQAGKITIMVTQEVRVEKSEKIFFFGKTFFGVLEAADDVNHNQKP